MKVETAIEKLKECDQEWNIEVLMDDDSIRQIADIDVLTYVGVDKKSAAVILKAVSEVIK